MPRLIVTERAVIGLERCHRFLADRDPASADRAGRAIAKQLTLLCTTPAIGRPFRDDAMLRELVIGFGATGYVALYVHRFEDDAVYVLAVRRQREAGY
jgi:plasmid stabilization system protein ParE